MQEIRRIELDNLKNTRDLGGYLTADGRRIREKRLIRSGALYGASEEELRKLTQEYRLRTVIDFRTAAERAGQPDPVPEGVTYVENPILQENMLGITREAGSGEQMFAQMFRQMTGRKGFDAAAYMEQIYTGLVREPYSRQQYRKFFALLAQQEEGAVLWHCSAGKDRVGVATACLLWALGVPEEQILADYCKVNEFTADMTETLLAGLVQKAQGAGLQEKETAAFSDCLRALLTVQEAYLLSVFEEMKQEAGGVDAFLERELGLDQERRERLAELYLE